MDFAFAIPLKPRSACADWDLAQANLRRTIRSAQAAVGSAAVGIVVACHDEPDLADAAAPDVHVLSVPFTEPPHIRDGGRDKAKKRRFIGAWLREALTGDALYVMLLDADDLVHKEVVRHVLSYGHGSYLVEDAYSLDLASGLLQHRRQGFDWARGSSFVCRFTPAELPSSTDDLTRPFSQFGASPDQRGHAEWPQVATELGRPPKPIPFPAVVYTVNHGESLWATRSGGHRALDSRDLVWPSAGRRILAEDFSAPDLARQLAGTYGTTVAFARASAARASAKLRRTARARIGSRTLRAHR
jgi:hypothetical protein